MRQALLLLCIWPISAITAQSSECDLQGQCQGSSTGILAASSGLECSKACSNDADCAWWTYDPSEPTTCLFWADCGTLDTVHCPQCVSGEKACFEEALTEIDVLFVTGRHSSSGNPDVEIVPMAVPAGLIDCPVVPDLSREARNGCAFLYEDQPVVCGVHEDYPLCYLFNTTAWSWTLFYRMNVARLDAEGVQMGDDYFITGGFNRDIYEYLDSTELFRAQNRMFTMEERMPFSLAYHCVAALNESHAVVIGGYNGSEAMAEVFMYHVGQGTVHQMPSLNKPRYHHSCGLATPGDGSTPYLVAVGGNGVEDDLFTSTEILRLDDDAWADGVPFVAETKSATSVAYANGFLLVGGAYSQSIWQYDPDLGESPWIERPERLADMRAESPSSVMVKAAQMQCH